MASLRSLKLELQDEQAECGLACYCMLANFFGQKRSLAEMRKRFALGGAGTNVTRLIEVGNRLSLATLPLRVSLNDLRAFDLPVVLHWDMNHFVVLAKSTRSKLVIYDPAVGIRRVTWDEASRFFTGIALQVEPAGFRRQTESELDSTPLRIRDLWASSKGLNSSILHVIAATAAMQATVVLSPLFMQILVDHIIPTRGVGLLLAAVSGFALVAIVQSVTMWIRALVVQNIGTEIVRTVSTSVFQHLLQLPMRYFEHRHSGGIISRFMSIDAIRRALTSGVLETVIDTVLVITLGITMVLYEWRLGLASLGVMGLLVCLRLLAYRFFYNTSHEALSDRSRAQSRLIETIRGIGSIKSMGAENTREELWRHSHDRALASTLKLSNGTAHIDAAQSLVVGVQLVLIAASGGYLVIGGMLTVGGLLAFVGFQTLCFGYLQRLLANVQELRLLKVHLRRIDDVVGHDIEQNRDGTNDEETYFEQPVSIRLKDVSFSYSRDGSRILRNVDLRVESGECLVIVGRTGIGKTTLLKLMLGLEDPTEGDVLVNGLPFSAVGKRNLRKRTGCVLQDDQLFEGTIFENISSFCDSPDRHKVKELLELVQLSEEVRALPMGINTPIGEAAKVLSGGQRQRIMLARALYRDPKLLILDEATAQLDLETEKRLVDALLSLEMTRIFVTHRPSLLRSANRILNVEGDGSVSEIVIGELTSVASELVEALPMASITR